jgi:hypothetical protein
MKNIILILVFISVSITAKAQTQQEQAILELSKKKFQWMISMKYDSLEPALDERMVFIHSNGWEETKTEFIEDIKTGKLRYTSINVLEASVRLYSGSAVIIGRGKFNVKLDGKDLEFDLKYTEFYVQKNGTWLLASRHSNRLQ